MADVQPFQGLRYSTGASRDLSALITPPYDIISASEQSDYCRKSPHNVIRLEFGPEQAGDSAGHDKYGRAASTFSEWIQKGVLQREKSPAFYLVESLFQAGGAQRSRWCLLARVRLEEFGQGSIKPHEVTMKKPIQDRLRLLEACRASFSPVMGMYKDGGKGSAVQIARQACNRAPDQEATDQGITYRVWVIAEQAPVRRITEYFSDKTLYIADGHHRYETAMTYSRERIAQGFADPSSADRFVMMSLMDTEDPGVLILPTHRLLKGFQKSDLAGLEQKLAGDFAVKELTPSPRRLDGWLGVLAGAGNNNETVFGVYGLEPGKFHLLHAKNKSGLQKLLPTDQPQVWKDLDLAILHYAVLPLLGLEAADRQNPHLEYTRDEEQALVRVDSGDCQLAVFVNPTPVASVIEVADAGARMPQKSTYFYPKAPAGLVINWLDA